MCRVSATEGAYGSQQKLTGHSIVAVHGLDEGGTTAWTHPDTGCSWIRDLISHEIPQSRVFTFDYKADVTSFFSVAARQTEYYTMLGRFSRS